jgi:hypothetical protein
MERHVRINNYMGHFLIKKDFTIELNIHDVVNDEPLASTICKTIEEAVKFFEEFIAPRVEYNLKFEAMCRELQNTYFANEIFQSGQREEVDEDNNEEYGNW